MSSPYPCISKLDPCDSMTEGKRFSRESFIYVVGEFLSKSFTFILIPIYASYLSVHDFAILSIVWIIWPIVVVVIGKGFSTYILRGYYEYSESKRFFGTVLFFSMVVGLVIAWSIHVIGPWLFKNIFKEMVYKPYLQYGVFFAVFRLFFNHVVSIYRAKRKPTTSVVLSVVLFLSNSVAVLTAIYVLKTDLKGILNAQLISFMVVAVIYLAKVFPDISLRLDLRVILPGILFVLPLVPHALSGWVINYISRIFIQRNMSPTDLATYAVASQISLILSVINNGLNQAWAPFIYANAPRDDFSQLFATNAKKLIIFASLLGGTIILFAKDILLIMGKKEYLAAQNVLPILILAYVIQLLYFIYIVIIIYHKNTKIMPLITISAGLICISLNIVLVPMWGMYGAAFCTMLSFLLMYLSVYGYSKRYVRVKIVNKRVIVFVLSVLFALVFSYFLINPIVFWLRILMKVFIVIGLTMFLRVLELFDIRNFIKTFYQG